MEVAVPMKGFSSNGTYEETWVVVVGAGHRTWKGVRGENKVPSAPGGVGPIRRCVCSQLGEA